LAANRQTGWRSPKVNDSTQFQNNIGTVKIGTLHFFFVSLPLGSDPIMLFSIQAG